MFDVPRPFGVPRFERVKLAILTTVLAIALPAGDADACKMPTPAPFEPVAEPGDKTPPSAPTVSSSIKEPTTWVFGACNTWCTANGVIDLMGARSRAAPLRRGGRAPPDVTPPCPRGARARRA